MHLEVKTEVVTAKQTMPRKQGRKEKREGWREGETYAGPGGKKDTQQVTKDKDWIDSCTCDLCGQRGQRSLKRLRSGEACPEDQ